MEKPSQEALSFVLSKWSLEGEPIFIRDNENCVYELSQKNIILRFTEPAHRTSSELLGELQWIETLSARVPGSFSRPLRNKDGDFLASLNDGGHEFLITVFHKALGASLLSEADFQSTTYRKLGEIIGRMHKFESQNDQTFERCEWSSDLGFLRAKAVAHPEDGRPYEIFQQALDWLGSLPKDETCFGLIHSDIHQGNFFVDSCGEITLFDFDDGQRHWFAYDLAVPIFSMESLGLSCKTSMKVYHSCQQALIEGYQSEYDLGNQWLEKLPHFITFRTILLFYWGKSRVEKNLANAESRVKILKMMDDCLVRLQSFEKFPCQRTIL